MVSTARWLDGKSGMYLEIVRLVLLAAFTLLGFQYYQNNLIIVILMTYILINFLALPILKKSLNNKEIYIHE
jgi:hypothetical protein